MIFFYITHVFVHAVVVWLAKFVRWLWKNAEIIEILHLLISTLLINNTISSFKITWYLTVQVIYKNNLYGFFLKRTHFAIVLLSCNCGKKVFSLQNHSCSHGCYISGWPSSFINSGKREQLNLKRRRQHHEDVRNFVHPVTTTTKQNIESVAKCELLIHRTDGTECSSSSC